MNMILEKLDSEVFTDELKKELQESFDASVEAKSAEKAVELVEAKEVEYKEYLAEEVAKHKTELADKLDAYLDQVVEKFVEENTLAMESAVKAEQMDAVLEGFNSLLIATGVEVATIAEAKEESDEEVSESIEKDLVEANETNDSLMEQLIELKAQNEELLKTGLIQEEMASLNVVQKEKFVKLAETLDFDAKDAVKFIAQLDAIKETIGAEVAVEEKKTEDDKSKETIIDESTKVDDKDKALYESKASHLY